jgi:hypothetical protein
MAAGVKNCDIAPPATDKYVSRGNDSPIPHPKATRALCHGLANAATNAATNIAAISARNLANAANAKHPISPFVLWYNVCKQRTRDTP